MGVLQVRVFIDACDRYSQTFCRWNNRYQKVWGDSRSRSLGLTTQKRPAVRKLPTYAVFTYAGFIFEAEISRIKLGYPPSSLQRDISSMLSCVKESSF
jgi:hypothetical protein